MKIYLDKKRFTYVITIETKEGKNLRIERQFLKDYQAKNFVMTARDIVEAMGLTIKSSGWERVES